MSSLNRATLIGNLGADPEVRHTQNNTAVATLSIATSEKYKDRDGQQVEKTEWHRVIAWAKLADICQKYLEKGDKVYIEGPIQTRQYEKDGQKRYATEIKALNMVMLGGGNGSSPGKPKHPAPVESEPNNLPEDLGENKDLPF